MEGLAGHLRKPDAELIGYAEHCDGAADLALRTQLGDCGYECLHSTGHGAGEPETVRPELAQFRSPVAQCGRRQLRVSGAVEQRRYGEVKSGAPRRKNEIDLILRNQPLDGRCCIVRIAMIVVLDDLDRHALADALEHDTAGGIHLLDPKVVIREDCNARARRVGAGQRDRISDLDRFRRFGVRDDAARRKSRECNNERNWP